LALKKYLSDPTFSGIGPKTQTTFNFQ